MSDTQLTENERYPIDALKKAGHAQAEIPRQLGGHRSTIQRELRRNAGQRGYRPRQANELAQAKLADNPKVRIPESTWTWVEKLINKKWSPEQISGWLTKEAGVAISHERIYRYVGQDKKAGGNLHTHLRCQKKRRHRYGSLKRSQRGQIKGRVSIDERPTVVDQRRRIGDWEADTVVRTY